MKYLFLLSVMVILLPCKVNAQNKPGHDLCYNSHISKAEYYHSLGQNDSSLVFLTLAQEYNVLIPQHYLSAIKIYISNEKYNKTYPLLRIMIKYGYKIESLLNEPEVDAFLSTKEELKQSLLSDHARSINRLKNEPKVAIIYKLFELDQKNRTDRMSGKTVAEFVETEKYIQRILIDSIIGTEGIPVLTIIGFEAHGKLFTLMLHQATNERFFGINLMDEITKAFEDRNYSSLEYGAILDRNSSHESGYAKYGIMGTSVNGVFTLGANIENIEKVDSIRHYDLGLPPLKYQAFIQNTEIDSNYSFKEYQCSDPIPEIKGWETRDTIPLLQH